MHCKCAFAISVCDWLRRSTDDTLNTKTSVALFVANLHLSKSYLKKLNYLSSNPDLYSIVNFALRSKQVCFISIIRRLVEN